MTRTPGLLVSVRSAAEARAALAGGADLIDVKEPTRGPMGAADPEVMAAVVAEVGGRVPVSVAMGELEERVQTRTPPGVSYFKWGLAGLQNPGPLFTILIDPAKWGPVVLVAYADHQRAGSPDPEGLANVACQNIPAAFLIDTATKDGSRLLDWIAPAALARIRFRLADAGVQVAFAGSLDADAIRTLAPLAPDWFAVRGAACVGGRTGTVCADRVRALKAVIAEAMSRPG